MSGPMDTIQEQQSEWAHSETKRSLLFPEVGDEAEFSDLIFEMNSKLETLTDLCQRLSFSMREFSQILKITPRG